VYPPMRRCFEVVVFLFLLGEVGEAEVDAAGEAGEVGAAGGNPPTWR
jgi:hypothetical protein